MPIYRAREIGDYYDFTDAAKADEFVKDESSPITWIDKDGKHIEEIGLQRQYVVSPATEKELQEEIKMLEKEISTHGEKMQQTHPNEYNETLMRLESYRNALGELKTVTLGISDTQLDEAIHHLIEVTYCISPSTVVNDEFVRMVGEMRKAGESNDEIVKQLSMAITDGLRFGNWPTESE